MKKIIVEIYDDTTDEETRHIIKSIDKNYDSVTDVYLPTIAQQAQGGSAKDATPKADDLLIEGFKLFEEISEHGGDMTHWWEKVDAWYYKNHPPSPVQQLKAEILRLENWLDSWEGDLCCQSAIDDLKDIIAKLLAV
jgi:hypothetical protein